MTHYISLDGSQRMILAHLRAWLAAVVAAVLDLIWSMQDRRCDYTTA